MQQTNQNDHTPVLLDQVLKYLNPQPGETYLDLTAGYGGHARAILSRTEKAPAILVDRDENAVNYLAKAFKGSSVTILHQDFLSASEDIKQEKRQFDLILADLGVSSPHLNMASRGFSFQQDGPLDMRMDQRQVLTAATIVNTFSERELVDIIKNYGEEHRAQRITRAIIEHRPHSSTSELASVIARVASYGKTKIHPATKTFQALRIAVNSELTQLEKAMPVWIDLLKPGGRLVVISFHSLEDRIVKRLLSEVSGNWYDASLKLLTKNPVTADRQELVFNPRARSAKLRAAAKINT